MILILGGNGFIGYNLVKKFCEIDTVRVFDRNWTHGVPLDRIEVRIGNFETTDFGSLLEDVDVVFHLISSIVPYDGTEGIMDDINANIIPTVRLLNAMVERRVSRFYFISSGGTVYGEVSGKAMEVDKLAPECVYAAQKISIENYIHLYRKYHGLNSYILRVGNPYGLDMNPKRNQGIIPIFTSKIMNEETIDIWGDGENKRDYILIDEVVEAIEAVYNYMGVNRIFNIGTGVSCSINEIVRYIEKKLEKKARVRYLEGRKCDLKNSVLDVSLIWEECRWKSKMKIEDGIEYYINLVKTSAHGER